MKKTKPTKRVSAKTTAKQRNTRQTPSLIRTRILNEHKILKAKIANLKKVAKATRASSSGAKLLSTTEDFIDTFLNHLLVEEAILRPLLEDIDAWGPVRVDRMDKDHRIQRARVEHIRDLVRRKRLASLRTELQSFVDDFIKEMRDEEKNMLSADLLRDDVIAIGATGG